MINQSPPFDHLGPGWLLVVIRFGFSFSFGQLEMRRASVDRRAVEYLGSGF